MQFKALGFEKMKTSTLILLYCIVYSAHVNSNNQIIKCTLRFAKLTFTPPYSRVYIPPRLFQEIISFVIILYNYRQVLIRPRTVGGTKKKETFFTMIFDSFWVCTMENCAQLRYSHGSFFITHV